MKVKLWGTRGSLPSPLSREALRHKLVLSIDQFLKSPLAKSLQGGAPTLAQLDQFVHQLSDEAGSGYGGDTSCVEVFSGEQRLLIDAGSGLRKFNQFIGNEKLHVKDFNFLITHFHWDHIVGLPFFAPFFKSGYRINFYSPHADLEKNIRKIFKKPFFPVPFEALQAEIYFNYMQPRVAHEIDGFQVTPYLLDHPDPSWGYRIQGTGADGTKKSYAHCVDSECTRRSPSELGEDIYLYRDADLCLFDAQFTLQEFLAHMNWGHSAAPIGLDLAIREGIKSIVFAHHDPAASDKKISEAAAQTQAFLDGFRQTAKKVGRVVPEISWTFAHDGDVFEL